MMNDEMVMLRDTLESALSQAFPLTWEPSEDGRMDPAVWKLTADLEWDCIGLSEEDGGFGEGVAALVLLAEMCGRHRVAAPLWETALGRWALASAGLDQPASGEVVTIADGSDLIGSGLADDHRYSGRLAAVPWAHDAKSVVVKGPEPGLLLLDLTGDGIAVGEGVNLAGEGRCDVTLENAELVELRSEDAVEAGALLLPRAGLLNGARLLGALRRILAITQEHTTARQQFGRPLARFQLVGAHLAEMTAHVTLVAALVDDAAAAHDAGQPAASTMSLGIVTAEAATAVCRSAHQCHGAIGVTREYWLQQFTRRAWSWRDEHGLERQLSRAVGAAAVSDSPATAWATTTPTEVAT
jgi:alkylation response protein AidB-like acyl-CoA dehydrogenase